MEEKYHQQKFLLQNLNCLIYLANCFFQVLAAIFLLKSTDRIFLPIIFERKDFVSASPETLKFTERYCYSILKKLKGNAQFLFLCNAQKSGASRVCIPFPQITQEILTEDIIYWMELITEILGFLQIFNVRKTNTQLF